MKKFFSFLVLLLGLSVSVRAADEGLFWQQKADRVDASIKDWDLTKLLKKISAQTSWQIYFEPGTAYNVSVKFKGLTADEALSQLLGPVNYSRQVTNGVTQLFVFKTDARAATQMIVAEKTGAGSKSHLIPNELVIKLKRGAKRSIEELARLTNGKIAGRDDKYMLYRLRFVDEAATVAAREILSKLTDDVAAIEANYSVDRPNPATPPTLATGGTGLLNPKAPPNGSLLVGLLDTAVQHTEMDGYLQGRISIAGQADLSGATPLHGTGMFETLVNAMGDNPSKVLSVDMYGSSEATSTYEIVEGLIKLIDAGANPINISSGATDNSPLLAQVVAEAIAKGITLVAAAGNEGGTANTYPAAYPGVIGVTAIDPQSGNIANYADQGDFVKAKANGVSYITLYGQTWFIEGTSVSAAVISGEVAGLAAQYHMSVQAAANRVMIANGFTRVR